MPIDTDILIETLAFADALFEPIRDWDASYYATTWELRETYSRLGLPYRGDGTHEYERALTRLVDDGLIIRRRARRKTVAVRLSPAGLSRAWELVGVEADTAMCVLQEVDRLGPHGRWVPETAFNDGRGWGDGCQEELKIVQRLHAPALLCGWIESHCDVRRHVAYRATKAGRAVLSEAGPAPSANGKAPAEPPEPDPEILGFYNRAYEEAIGWLSGHAGETAESKRSIGRIPLSMAVWDRMR